MKKQRLLIMFFSMVLLYSSAAFAGCKVSPSAFCHNSTSGSDIVTVTAQDSSCGAWTAISNNTDWIRVISGASGNGNGTATISWSANTTGAERIAAITIAGQTVNFTQSAAGQDSCAVVVPVTPTTPSNDAIQDAYSLNKISATGGSLSGSNVGATRQYPFITGQPEEPYHANFPPKTSVWYRWTPPYSQSATIETTGSDFDTVLAVYALSDGDYLERIASNDDIYEGLLQSQVSFDAIKDKKYYIAVTGKNSGIKAEGNIEFSWFLAPEVISAVIPQKITSLEPKTVNIGDVQNGFKEVTVNGTNFSSDSQVYINGSPIKLGSTSFNGSTKLTASIPASYLGAEKSLKISVRTGNNVSDSRKLGVVKAVELLAEVGMTISKQIADVAKGINLDVVANNLGTVANNVTVTMPTPDAPLAGAVGAAVSNLILRVTPAEPFKGSIKTVVTALVPPTLVAPAAALVAAGSLNLVPKGDGLVGNDGGSMVAAGGLNLVAAKADLVGNDGAGLVGLDGGTMVAAGGGNVIGQNGATMVAAGGGNVIGQNGANSVAAGGGNKPKLASSKLASSDGNGWFFVKSSGGTAPTVTTATGDNTASATVAVTFDESSTPKASELANMVLALVVDPKLSPCDATLSSTLLLVVPVLTYNGQYYWANFQYSTGSNFTLTNAGSVADSSVYSSCSPASQSPDLKLHIPAVTYNGGSYSVDFQCTTGITFPVTGSAANCTTTAAVTFSQTIGTISFSPPTLAVGGATSASATATSGLAVSFSSVTPGVCSVSGSTVTGVATGTCTIAADQAGNASYSAAAQVTQSITIVSTPTTLSASGASASAGGLTGTVSVTATTGSTWTATSNASWITVTSGSGGNGTGTVVYAVAVNTGASSRTGTLTIGGQTFTVTQAGASVASPGTWTALPGASPSRPSLALNAATGKIQMVVRSVSDQLYVGNFNSGGTFEGWNALPGASPSVVAQAWHPVLNKMLMVVRAAGDQLYLGTFSSAGSFEGWSALPGASPSPVALAWHATLNKMFMVVRASNDQLYLGTFNSAGSFEGWSALSGASPSPVALAWHATLNKMFMVVRAANDQLYLGTFDSAGSFGGWSALSGASPSPVALAWHPASSKMVMAVRGADDQLWQGTFGSTSGAFEGWSALSGTSPTAPVLATGQSNLQLVVRSTDDQLWSLLVQ